MPLNFVLKIAKMVDLFNHNEKIYIVKADNGLGCSSAVEHLPSMHEALHSIPATQKQTDKQIHKGMNQHML
jgi:hypothetical protein